MEWLFLTCHNYWIVCRLVRDNDHPFLAYSPNCSINNSSEPFQALLGAILSVHKDVPVQASISDLNMELDVIPEEQGPEDESYGNDSSELMVCPFSSFLRLLISSSSFIYSQITSSSPHSPESFQVWIHLQPLPNNTFVLPQYAKNRNGTQCLWLTHIIGSGSTGNVIWQGHFDSSASGDSFAIKVVEFSHDCEGDEGDEIRQQQFCNELGVYLSLEMAYQSGKLHYHITPHCYGAFEGNNAHVLILELCHGTLNGWDELNISER